MRVELEALHSELKATMIYVTHDQVEAMTMADKIVVLQAGRIEQVGSPMELYHRPRTEFVAGFIGAPSMNFLDIRSVGGRITCGEAVIGTAAPVPGAVRLGIRPEHTGLTAPGAGEMDGTVVLRETLGGDAYLYVRTAAGQVVVRADGDTALNHGDTVGLSMPANRLHLFGADGVTLSSGGVAV
jgi:ABC-type sugar transport system ATPase subunit